MSSFIERVRRLPTLGVGVSTEYGAHDDAAALDLEAVASAGLADFLEVGVEVSKGVDGHARRWVERGLPTTYHFLDVNLDDPRDFDAAWLDGLRREVAVVRPAWLCGDAGMWHFGRRDRGQMLLLPPVLEPAAAQQLAWGVDALRANTGLEVLPENPPGTAFLGSMHLLDFFALVADRADTGLLLDVAHLAIYQHATGRGPRDGFDGFPWDRVVEVHLAGGAMRSKGDFSWIEDTHGVEVLDSAWRIFEEAVARAPNLRAVVVECERNPLQRAAPLLERVRALVPSLVPAPGDAPIPPPRVGLPPPEVAVASAQAAAVLACFDGVWPAPEGARRDAFDTDPHRVGRALQALADEYPVSFAHVGLARARQFFRSEAFESVVRDGGSMAVAFGAWAPAADMGVLEHAMARARRPGPPPPPGRVEFAPGVAFCEVAEDTLARWDAARDALAGRLRPGPSVLVTVPRESVPVGVLVTGGTTRTPRGEELPAALTAVLRLVPTTVEALVAAAGAAGADPGEDAAVVDGLLAEGVLVAG